MKRVLIRWLIMMTCSQHWPALPHTTHHLRVEREDSDYIVFLSDWMSSHHHDHHQQAIILYSMCSATDAVTAAALVSALIKQPQTTACNSEVAKLNTNCTEGDTERDTAAADEREWIANQNKSTAIERWYIAVEEVYQEKAFLGFHSFLVFY